MRTSLLVAAVGALWVAAGSSTAAGQTVEAAVVDGASGEPVPGAELVLRNEGGTVVARGLTDAEGRVVLVGRSAGPHVIEATRLGYVPIPPQTLEVGRETVEVEIRLTRSPLAIDPLTVTGRRRDPRHDATLEGALWRYEQFPPVGPRRVVLRETPFFTASQRVLDVLRWFPGRSGCTILYRDGRMENDPTAVREHWLETSTEFWQAIEFYRRWTDAPLEMRGIPAYVYDPMNCSVVAVWSRDDPVGSGRPLWQRLAFLGGFAAAMWGVISLAGF